jgi:hypothetical protein
MKRSHLWKISKETLEIATQESNSFTKLLLRFGTKNSGAAFTLIRKILDSYGIDYSHIPRGTGAWNKENNRAFFRQKCAEYVTRWQDGLETGHCQDFAFTLSDCVRKYIFEKFGNKCAKCGWKEINPFTDKIPLQVHHIDGNASNSFEINLILLCPNCHSLTKNFGRSNTKSARIGRHGRKSQIAGNSIGIRE